MIKILNKDNIHLLKGLLSTLETVNEELECNGDCEECVLEFEDNKCMASEISTLKNTLAEMEGV